MIINWKAPTNIRGVQSFLGFCNFYRQFIYDYGKVARLLVQLTKVDVPFQFNKACWDVFEELKALLTSVLILQYYNLEFESMIETNVLDRVIASILS